MLSQEWLAFFVSDWYLLLKFNINFGTPADFDVTVPCNVSDLMAVPGGKQYNKLIHHMIKQALILFNLKC